MLNPRLLRHAYARPVIYSMLLIGMGLFFWDRYSVASGEYNDFDLRASLVAKQDIYHGGPPRDGIPALYNPQFTEAQTADFLHDDDRILGLFINGIAKAYPLRIMNWHEIVNDEFVGTPALVTYCPLCGTGMAFSPIQAGEKLRFGVSGLLYNSDMLLYDQETESLWSQILRQAISGKLKGNRLKPLTLVHTTWQEWRTEHPKTLVLSTQTGHARNYSQDPYAGYENNQALYFPVKHQDRRYHAKERVIGITLNNVHKAYPFVELGKLKTNVLQDSIAGQSVKLHFNAAKRTARIFDAQGKELPTVNAFWFAWVAFHPETLVFTINRK